MLEEGETRCESCNKFAAKIEGFIMMCPHCDEPITEEDQ